MPPMFSFAVLGNNQEGLNRCGRQPEHVEFQPV